MSESDRIGDSTEKIDYAAVWRRIARQAESIHDDQDFACQAGADAIERERLQNHIDSIERKILTHERERERAAKLAAHDDADHAAVYTVCDLEVKAYSDSVSITGPMGDYWCDLDRNHLAGLLSLLQPNNLTLAHDEIDRLVEDSKVLERDRDAARAECDKLRERIAELEAELEAARLALSNTTSTQIETQATTGEPS